MSSGSTVSLCVDGITQIYSVTGIDFNGTNNGLLFYADGSSVVFGNSADYASHIEYGTPKRPNWKWAEGAHMMTISMNELLRDMPEFFDYAFREFLKSKGIV